MCASALTLSCDCWAAKNDTADLVCQDANSVNFNQPSRTSFHLQLPHFVFQCPSVFPRVDFQFTSGKDIGFTVSVDEPDADDIYPAEPSTNDGADRTSALTGVTLR